MYPVYRAIYGRVTAHRFGNRLTGRRALSKIALYNVLLQKRGGGMTTGYINTDLHTSRRRT